MTAPSRTSACASSKFVMPTLQPGCRAVDGDEDDPAVLQLADGAARGARAELRRRELLARRNTGAPSRTICGPPPMAATIPGQAGCRSILVFTGGPGRGLGLKLCRRGSLREQHGAARRDRDGGRAGDDRLHRRQPVDPGRRTGEREEDDCQPSPAPSASAGPHAEVNSAVPFASGTRLRTKGCAAPVPVQAPVAITRRTSSVPSDVMPAVERLLLGRLRT